MCGKVHNQVVCLGMGPLFRTRAYSKKSSIFVESGDDTIVGLYQLIQLGDVSLNLWGKVPTVVNEWHVNDGIGELEFGYVEKGSQGFLQKTGIRSFPVVDPE